MTNYQNLAVQEFRLMLIALLLIASSAFWVFDAQAATPASEPSTDTSTPTSVPLPYSDPVKLVFVPETLPSQEVQSPFKLPAKGFIQVAFVANKTATKLGDLDVFEMHDRLYIAQVRDPGGYILTDVTNPAEPEYLGTWKVSPKGGGEHIEAFRQGSRWYLTLPLADDRAQGLICGLAIIEITDPLNPTLQGLYNGLIVGAGVNWCDVHSAEDCLLAQPIEGLLRRKPTLKSSTPAAEIDPREALDCLLRSLVAQ